MTKMGDIEKLLMPLFRQIFPERVTYSAVYGDSNQPCHKSLTVLSIGSIARGIHMYTNAVTLKTCSFRHTYVHVGAQIKILKFNLH